MSRFYFLLLLACSAHAATSTGRKAAAGVRTLLQDGQCRDLDWCANWAGDGSITTADCATDAQVAAECPVFCGTCGGGAPTDGSAGTPTQPATGGGGGGDGSLQAPTGGTVSASSEGPKLLQLVNNARAQAGAPPLCLNSKLSAAAQRHSEDMARTGQLSHTGSDGSSEMERFPAAGYMLTGAWGYGENILDDAQTAQAAFDRWMNSPGHRGNILNPSFKHMGLGIATDPRGRTWWTQTFGYSSSEGCS